MRRLLGIISLAALSLTNACSSETADTDHAGASNDEHLELTVADLSRDLSQGMTGDEVRVVQRYLRQFGYLPSAELAARYPAWRPIVETAPAPGTFDDAMVLAVAALQERSGLAQSGIVDAPTRELLRQHRCGVPEGLPDVDPSEKFALGGSRWSDKTLYWKYKNLGGHTLQEVAGAYRAAMTEWKTHTSLTFLETTGSADIELQFVKKDGPSKSDGTGAVLASASQPVDGGDISIDEEESWSFGSTTPGTAHDLQSVVLHELGHALGLKHSAQSAAVMFPFIGKGVQKRTLVQDDKTAISSLYDVWEQTSGKGSDVAVGAQGSVWLIGDSTAADHGVYIWQGAEDGWRRDPDMTGIRVAVDKTGVPWVVRSNGQLFKRKSKFISTAGWDQVLACAKDVGAGANGDVWIIGCNVESGGFEVRKFNNGLFDEAPGSGVRISVAPDGKPWIVNNTGKIFRRTTNRVDTGNWEAMPGSAKDIGAGPEGDVWVIGTSATSNGNFTIHTWDEQAEVKDSGGDVAAPARREWIKVDGGATTIGVGPFGPWVISAAHNIFQSEK